MVVTPAKVLCAVVLALAVFLAFYNLHKPAIFMWDEAIYANNALEMSIDKDFLTLHNNGEPSLYNTKPPLVIWLQCICIWIFGANEFAVRLPSALAVIGTCIMLLLFARYTLKDVRIGIVAVLVLLASQGFMKVHVARSGDLDAVLVFFITAYTLLFWHLLLTKDMNSRVGIALVTLLVFCAFMTKSIAAFLPFPGLLVGVILIRKAKPVLARKDIYISAAVIALFITGYYLLKEHFQPGYINKAFYSEVMRYGDDVMPWHNNPFWSYLNNAYNEGFFIPFLLMLPLGFVGFFAVNGQVRQTVVLAACFIVGYFLVISYPDVKLSWYDAPLYPFMGLFIGIGIITILERLPLKESLRQPVFAVVLMLIFSFPLYRILISLKSFKPREALEWEGYSIRQISHENPELKQYSVLMKVPTPEHLDQAGFYVKSLNHYKGYDLQLVQTISGLQVGDTALCSQPGTLVQLGDSLGYTVVKEMEFGKLVKIESRSGGAVRL